MMAQAVKKGSSSGLSEPTVNLLMSSCEFEIVSFIELETSDFDLH